MTATERHLTPNGWTAVARSRDIGRRPVGFSFEGRRLVAFRAGPQRSLQCLLDRCPHRFAPLSKGRVTGDEIECLYHGWRFDGSGLCRAMPGLTGDLPRAAVPAIAITERDGLVFVAREAQAAAPYTGALSGTDAVSRIVTSRVRSRLVDVAENILDATHTHFTHRWLLRGLSSQRYRVRVTVTGGAGWVEARYEGEPRQHGVISSLLEGERSVGVGRFLWPGIAELEFWGPKRINLATTFHLRQTSADRVEGLGILAGPRQGGLGHLKAALFEPMFRLALLQDQRMLEAAYDNAPVSSEGCKAMTASLDVLRPHIEAILRGDMPPAAIHPAELTMEL